MKCAIRRIFTAFLAVLLISACNGVPDSYDPVPSRNSSSRRDGVRSTAFFLASDRHENGSGNNLTALLRLAAEGSEVTPTAVLLDGDYVGGGRTPQPAFTVDDIYNEIDSVLTDYKAAFSYGSHDANCTDGYEAFLSGPMRLDGYYAYGISFAQMEYATDSLAGAAIAAAADTVSVSGRRRGYSGLDKDDPRGISAESGSASFLAWAASLTDHDPIVVLSHMPLHAARKDNLGASTWLPVLSRVAAFHDILFVWAHNHTVEEGGGGGGTPPDRPKDGEDPSGGGERPPGGGKRTPADRNSYLLVPGDSILVQTPVDSVSVRMPVNFTYVNGGYIKSGFASVVTFTDTENDGRYDRMRIERFTIHPADSLAGFFGTSGRATPYEAALRGSARAARR